MQSVSSRIWTRVAVSISYDDNHNTTGTSILLKVLNREKNIWIELKNNGICAFHSFMYSSFWNSGNYPNIWTRVTVSISYDDNHYTMGTSMKLLETI